MSASRWQPAPVLIWTTGAPLLRISSASIRVSWSPSMTETGRVGASSVIVRRSSGAPVVQINTGAGCHLDADMVARGLAELRPADGSLVFVENVGNLVCPALFDLGEAARVVVVSVTEGEDKPLKYPYMFAVADVVVINKIDLLPYVDVRLDRLTGRCREVNAGVQVLPLSVTTGEGIAAWCEWLLTSEPVLA
jgi:hydrogenase nickel incorporation protein HypB